MDAVPADPNDVSQIPEAAEVATPVSKESRSEQALIGEFSTLVETPMFLREAFERMQSDRDYVANMVYDNDDDAVCVNQVLKNQQSVIAHLGIDDPKASCKPVAQVGGTIDPLMAKMAETCEIFLNQQILKTRLQEIMEGVAQDAQTNGVAWVKVSLQEDFYKDALGRNRFNDQQENVAEYERLKTAFLNNEFTEDDADYQRFKDLDSTLKTWMAEKILSQPAVIPVTVVDPLTGIASTQPMPDPEDPRTQQKAAIINGETVDVLGCPELERYLGFSIDAILPEDVRWDWGVSRPEEIRKGAWMAYRVFMSREDIGAKFQLESEELARVNVYSLKGDKTERRWGVYSPTDRPSVEVQQINDRCAVWTMEHRVQGRRYVWIDGLKRFLANEPLSAVGENPFSLFPVYFNRVSGHAMPISDVRLQRDLQDEYNLLRTHDRGGRRASYPWVALAAGAADQEDIDAIENRTPFQAVLLKKPDAIDKHVKEFNGAPYNPGVYDTSKVVADMQMMASIPMTGLGVQGAGKLATDLSLANAGMEKSNDRRQKLLNRTLNDMLQWMAQVAIKVFPAENIQAMCGPGAIWLALSAEQLTQNFQIEIKGDVQGPPDFKSKMQFWTAFPDIVGKLASVPGINVMEVLTHLMQLGGINEDPRKYYTPMLPMAMPGMPGMTPPDDNAPTPSGGPPQAQGGYGEAGGAPPMQSAPSANRLPNNPQARLNNAPK
jgi:hypothetical protein